MDIPDPISWNEINKRLKELEVIGINHLSYGFPLNSADHVTDNVMTFFNGMKDLLNIEKSVVVKPTEVFYYPNDNTPGYEHLALPFEKPLFHIEIDVNNSDTEITKLFPKAWEEQPHMFWITVSKDFLGMIWAVIITNKRR